MNKCPVEYCHQTKKSSSEELSPVNSLTVLASNLKSYRTLTVLYFKIKKHEMTTESNIKRSVKGSAASQARTVACANM